MIVRNMYEIIIIPTRKPLNGNNIDHARLKINNSQKTYLGIK